MTNFLSYAVGTAFFPFKSMKRLLGEPRPIRAAAGAVVFVGVLYVLTSAVMALAGAVPLAPVFVLIPAENYYFWQMILILPGMLLAWGLVSGLDQILGRRARGRPAFEKTASAVGIALAASLFVAWFPAAFVAFFLALGMSQQELVDLLSQPGGWQTFYVSLYVLAAVAAAVLLTLAVGQGRPKKAGRIRVVLAGGFVAVVLAGMFVLFVR
jgi:hypothetical protein